MVTSAETYVPVLWGRKEKFLSGAREKFLSASEEAKFLALLKAQRPELHTAAYQPRITGIVLGWPGLAKLASRYMGGGWLFRGQSSAKYPLRPTIGRPDVRKDATTYGNLPYALEDERWILDQFMLRSRPYLDHEPAGLLEWLAIAQHHGMPTRLLDWTESFLVAAYFATTNAGKGAEPAVIYAMPIPLSAKGNNNPFNMATARFYRPPHISPRIQAQTGVFTVHPKPTREFRPAGLEIWLIDFRQCFNIKKHLDACGVNHSSLFPGIDGLAQYFKWRYKWPRSRKMI